MPIQAPAKRHTFGKYSVILNALLGGRCQLARLGSGRLYEYRETAATCESCTAGFTVESLAEVVEEVLLDILGWIYVFVFWCRVEIRNGRASIVKGKVSRLPCSLRAYVKLWKDAFLRLSPDWSPEQIV